MRVKEQSQAPGIGVLGEIKVSNYGTRAVKVLSGMLTPELLHREAGDPAFREPGVSRSIIKGVSTHPFVIGEPILDHTQPFFVEAQIPFQTADNRLFWNVIGRNAASRMPSEEVVLQQKEMIREIATNPKYTPQTVGEMKQFIQDHNPGISYHFERITPDNFSRLEEGLRTVYGEAFKQYPYDVVDAIRESCGENMFVVAAGNTNQVFSVTGAEYLSMEGGVVVAEIGDTASLPNVSGFGPLLKRVLFQQMIEEGVVPDLVFTDSRLDLNGSVIKANQRSGLYLNPDIILPSHTTIASNRAHGWELMQTTSDGTEFPVENMTMTYLDRSGVNRIIQTYGKAY